MDWTVFISTPWTFEADSLDGVLTSLDTLSVAERKRTTDRVSAELDSLERVVATARFGELTDPDRFEQAAASALDGVATLLRHIDARVRNPDLTFPEGSREVWAELTGELAELHAESEIAVIMAPGRSLAASDSARLAFAHGLVALDQALHALAHDVGVPPDSIRPETTP